MRVLVTRPQPAAIGTGAKLEALGHQPVYLPMAEAIHQPDMAVAALGLPHAAIAFTSAEAVRAIASARDRLPLDLSTPVFCVGHATADAARQFGFLHVVAGPGTGAGLAQTVVESAFLSERRGDLVYLAGQPRSPGFEDALHAAGHAFLVAEVYRMSAIDYAPADIGRLVDAGLPDAVLFYSHETARQFFALLRAGPESAHEAAVRRMRCLCLSNHVAAAVPADMPARAIAAAPDEDSLLSLL